MLPFAFLCILIVSLCFLLKTSLTPHNSQFMVLLKQHMELSSLNTTFGWPPFYAPTNIPLWALYNECCLQICISTGPIDKIPPLRQGILTSAYTWTLHLVLLGASGNYMDQPLRQVPPPLPLSPHCQHKAARWVTAPLPRSSWLLVSEGRLAGSGNLKDRWPSIPSSTESTMRPEP
jgi:hypothetical protein